jgi:hypothetical protein
MTLSELILEYVSVSKRVDVSLHKLLSSGTDWRKNQDALELEERLSELQAEFCKHGLHTVALECALQEKQLNDLRIMLLRNQAA